MLDEKIIIFRLCISALLGAVIGLEREFKKRPAGFRTHIIVSLGSTLFMLIAIDGFNKSGINNYDSSRIAAQIVSGIGFLGAGTILHNKDKVNGLTTAGTLWLSAAIGTAVGIGYYIAAVFSVGIGIITLVALRKVTNIIEEKQGRKLELIYKDHKCSTEYIRTIFKEHDINILHLKSYKSIKEEYIENRLVIYVTFNEMSDLEELFVKLIDDDKIEEAKYIFK
ncbi:MAG: MgtC/SapB family protein [Peptoniphilaceae bacterium]